MPGVRPFGANLKSMQGHVEQLNTVRNMFGIRIINFEEKKYVWSFIYSTYLHIYLVLECQNKTLKFFLEQ